MTWLHFLFYSSTLFEPYRPGAQNGTPFPELQIAQTTTIMKSQFTSILLLVGMLTNPTVAGLVSPDCVSIKTTVTGTIERGDFETSRQHTLVRTF